MAVRPVNEQASRRATVSNAMRDRSSYSWDKVDMRFQRLERIAGSSLTADIIQEAARRAAETVRPIIIGYIQANLRAAGIQSRTGKLDQAVQSIIVESDRQARLIIRFPAGIGNYENGSDPYEAWAAIEHGAVRMPRVKRRVVDVVTGSAVVRKESPIGSKAKRTIKKARLGEEVSQRALDAVDSGRILQRGRNRGMPIVEDIAVNDPVVVRPKPFFQLQPAQRAQVQAAYADAVAAELLPLAA